MDDSSEEADAPAFHLWPVCRHGARWRRCGGDDRELGDAGLVRAAADRGEHGAGEPHAAKSPCGQAGSRSASSRRISVNWQDCSVGTARRCRRSSRASRGHRAAPPAARSLMARSARSNAASPSTTEAGDSILVVAEVIAAHTLRDGDATDHAGGGVQARGVEWPTPCARGLRSRAGDRRFEVRGNSITIATSATASHPSSHGGRRRGVGALPYLLSRGSSASRRA